MKCRDPRVTAAKAAAKRLNMAAAAGPSQLTNHDVAAVTRLPERTQTACKLGRSLVAWVGVR